MKSFGLRSQRTFRPAGVWRRSDLGGRSRAVVARGTRVPCESKKLRRAYCNPYCRGVHHQKGAYGGNLRWSQRDVGRTRMKSLLKAVPGRRRTMPSNNRSPGNAGRASARHDRRPTAIGHRVEEVRCSGGGGSRDSSLSWPALRRSFNNRWLKSGRTGTVPNAGIRAGAVRRSSGQRVMFSHPYEPPMNPVGTLQETV
jgi:hypothetical protein